MQITSKMEADAVFKGGGVKGIRLVGAASVVEEKGYEWSNLAGTSGAPASGRNSPSRGTTRHWPPSKRRVNEPHKKNNREDS